MGETMNFLMTWGGAEQEKPPDPKPGKVKRQGNYKGRVKGSKNKRGEKK